jgi:hypothetical protein
MADSCSHCRPLSDRLETKHGILIMGVSSAILLLYTGGSVRFLVVLYAINVFLTFSLSQLGMFRYWLGEGRLHTHKWFRYLFVHGIALVLCLSILVLTTVEKFTEGGWLTLVITTSLIVLCLAIHKHYEGIRGQIRELDTILSALPAGPGPRGGTRLDPASPWRRCSFRVTEVWVSTPSSRSNVSSRATIGTSCSSPSAWWIRDGSRVRARWRHCGPRPRPTYAVMWASPTVSASTPTTGTASTTFWGRETLCTAISREYPRAVFYLGKLVFAKEKLYYRVLHNDTAYALQRQLQFGGMQTVVLPIRITLG